MSFKRLKVLLGGFGVGCLLAGPAQAQTPVAISISNSPGMAIAPHFVGLSFGPSALAEGVFTPTNTQMLTIFQNLGIQYFRMGGTEVDTTTDAEDTAYADSFFGFIANAGITDVIYSLKLENGDSNQDASVAGYIWTNYQKYLTCFALGNEPNLNSDDDPAMTNFSTYFAKWQTFAAAITNAVPLAKFGGPDDAGSSSWDNDFANAEAGLSNVVEIHSHWYIGGSSTGLSASQMISNMLSPGWVTNGYPSHYDSYETVAAADGFPFRLTEFDSFSSGNVPGGSDGFASALFALDAMHWWAQQGCAGLSVHTGLSNLNGAVWQDASGNWQLFPWAYAIKTFDLGSSGCVEPLTLSNTNNLNITAYAVGTPTNIFVTIINKENGISPRDAAMTITVNGFPGASAAAIQLLAPGGNLQATNGITLGGAYITNNAPWSGQWTALGYLTNNQCTFIVSAGSAAVISITAYNQAQALLQVQTSGLGDITPNDSNAVLNVGQDYSITAVPGNGFIFTNWTGGASQPLGILTNGTTLQFVMQSNLVLQANFLDVAVPTLTITSPFAGQLVNYASFSVMGTTGDNWAVSNVWYQLNGGAWNNATTANDWTNWSATVMLSPGTNIICAYAVDTSGNISATNSVNFLYSTNLPGPAYFQAITNLNPIGYWPMHETEPAAQGDIETNYGTLGLLGTGYYSDWEGGASASRIHRGFPGALANDTDPAVYFGPAKPNVGADAASTNGLYVPHTSPLATLNPPFSVECWYEATNSSLGTNGQGDILGQSAYEGLNAGKNGNGDGNVCGFRLYWNVTKIIVETYANSSANNAVATSSAVTTNQWYHIVVTCDTGTNFSLWVNGNEQVNGAAGVGQYIPDDWGAFEVGCSRGDTHPANGLIDEVAVYPNVIGDINTHYNDGINGAAGAYFHDVTNDNPIIYLRMDGPTYTPPSGPFPVLTNYGSAAINGVYTPGTMPGLAPGPATPGGVPFTGLSGSTVAPLSGVSSFADAGYAAAYNPVGANPFSISAMFRGNPCDGRLQDIVGHSDNSWRILMSTNGTLQCQLGTNAGSQVNSTGVYNDGYWHQVVEVYSPNSNPTLPGTNAMYVDGVLDSMTNGVTPSGILPGTNSDVMIGTDPQYTNNLNGVGRQFAGQICEVALFTNALTMNQVQQLCDATIPAAVNLSPANIIFSAATNQLRLSWPTDHTGWTLQAQTNSLSVGIGTNWVDVANTSTTNQVIIPINLTNGCVFYRLVYP